MLGIIGGTGLYKLDGAEACETVNVMTPYGNPSSEIEVAQLGGRKVAFLSRHGSRHELLPSEVNYRANIWALKSIGVTRIVSVSAVGSLQEEIQPGTFAIPVQYIDSTRGRRKSTFFGEGMVAHVSSAEPVCSSLVRHLMNETRSLSLPVQTDLTYVCVEGPRLGTRAESKMLRNMGAHVVGMTNVPEVFLSLEAQMCYASFCVVTDYDAWRSTGDGHASTSSAIEIYKKSIADVHQVLGSLIVNVDPEEACPCRSSLTEALLTDERELVGEKQKLLTLLRR